jgi:uncharacterized protein YkwD
MKYYLSIFSFFTTILGIATISQADMSIPRSSSHPIDRVRTSTPHPRLILNNGNMSVIGSIKSSSAQSQPRKTAYLTMNSLEIGIYQQVNQYRQSRNLPPLGIDPIVSERAKAHSEQMARTSNLSHSLNSLDPKTYPSAAENIATSRGYRSPEILAVRDWISSPLHHRHLIGRFNLTGIGVARNARGEYYFTQIFVYKR